MEKHFCFSCFCKRKILVVAAVAVLAVAAVAAIVVTTFVVNQDENGLDPPDPVQPLPPSSSVMGNFREAAVASNGYLCADIGR